MKVRLPVLIGAGQFTFRGFAGESPSPTQLLKIAAERAADDAGLSAASLAGVDALGVVGYAVDAPGRSQPIPHSSNPPRSLAAALGAAPGWSVYTRTGGNSPQMLVNVLAEKVARGEIELGLAVGAEFMGSGVKRLRQGLPFDDWDEPSDLPPPDFIGDARPGASPYEERHGLRWPINTYPLFENALRARDGRSIPEHQARLGRLFAPFTQAAAQNPHAWFPVARSAEELVTVNSGNRMVGFPYPKLLNAIMEVDQSAGLLIASEEKALALGVRPERFVYLHGCADAADLWWLLERRDFHSSPAMRLTGAHALEMAGVGLQDIALFDLYSCFPSAVQIGAEALGLALDDPRGLTVTGGLPYAGGPGNNYTMHSIAAMMARLRARRDAFGLVTGNGWHLTKQSTGVYSTRRPARPFERPDPAVLQRTIDGMAHPQVVERPEGPAVVETYTVAHDRHGPSRGIVIGRDEAGRRFAANTPSDPATLAAMLESEQIGRRGRTESCADGVNLFTLE